MTEQEFKIRIKPEWTEDSKKFVAKLKKDMNMAMPVSSKSAGAGTFAAAETAGDILSGGKGKTAGGSSMGQILTKLGIAAGGIGIIVSALNHFKPIVSLVGNITKMLLEFLRPIADMITILLVPILQALRPILMMVRVLMQPFRALAYKLLGEGGKAMQSGDMGKATALYALAFQTLMTGIQAMIMKLFISVLDMAWTGLAQLLSAVAGAIVGFFANIFGASDEQIKALQERIKGNIMAGMGQVTDAMELAAGMFVETQIAGISKTAKTLGVNVDQNFRDVTKVVRQHLVGEDNSMIGTFDNFTTYLASTINIDLGNALDNIVGKFRKAADDINSIQIRGSSGGGSGGLASSFLKYTPLGQIITRSYNAITGRK